MSPINSHFVQSNAVREWRETWNVQHCVNNGGLKINDAYLFKETYSKIAKQIVICKQSKPFSLRWLPASPTGSVVCLLTSPFPVFRTSVAAPFMCLSNNNDIDMDETIVAEDLRNSPLEPHDGQLLKSNFNWYRNEKGWRWNRDSTGRRNRTSEEEDVEDVGKSIAEGENIPEKTERAETDVGAAEGKRSRETENTEQEEGYRRRKAVRLPSNWLRNQKSGSSNQVRLPSDSSFNQLLPSNWLRNQNLKSEEDMNINRLHKAIEELTSDVPLFRWAFHVICSFNDRNIHIMKSHINIEILIIKEIWGSDLEITINVASVLLYVDSVNPVVEPVDPGSGGNTGLIKNTGYVEWVR
ncbi:hypothetical protein LXL04_013234 [Taraxacum kok-saghyz]